MQVEIMLKAEAASSRYYANYLIRRQLLCHRP